jgi:DNA polymerase eta
MIANIKQCIFVSVDRAEAMNCWLDSVYEGDYNIQDKKLAVGAMISEEMRAAVYEETGFRCSAGIAHNKVCCYIFLSY